jgi:sugar (pentulose or hexulose) kinase
VRDCVLSVDVSTTALKAMLLAPEGTAVGKAARARTRGTTRADSGVGGAMEQDPNDWLEKFRSAARDLLAPSMKTTRDLNLPKSLTNAPVSHGTGDFASTAVDAVTQARPGGWRGASREKKPSDPAVRYVRPSGSRDRLRFLRR